MKIRMAILCCLLPAVSFATVTVPYSLFPGEEYRLAFVVDYDNRTTASNPDISAYNDYLTNLANSVPELSALGSGWSIMGHSATVKAWDNTNSNPTTSLGVPVFQLDGGRRVADDYQDLWDGTFYQAILVDQNGAEIDRFSSGSILWSGGSYNFNSPISGNELGSAGGQTYIGSVFAAHEPGLQEATPTIFHTDVQGELNFVRAMADLVFRVPDAQAPVHAQAGTIAALARKNDLSPSGNGTLNFIQDRPVINDAGNVLFAAEYAFTDGGFSDRAAAILHDGDDLIDLARGGDPSPDGNGVLQDISGAALANDGTALFYAVFGDTTGTTYDNEAVVAVNNGLQLVIREDAPEPGGDGTVHIISYADMPPLALNETGTVVINLELADVAVGNGSANVVTGEAGNMYELIRRGDNTPSGNGEYGNFFLPSINDWGQIAVSISGLANANPSDSANGMILRQDPGSSIGEKIARANDLSPDGNGKFRSFAPATDINNAGEVAFVASFSDTDGGSTNEDGFALLRGDGTDLHIVARTGESAPDGNGEFRHAFSSFDNPVINDFGTVAFQTRYRETAGGASDDRGIVRVDVNANGRQMREVVREGWLMANGVDTFDTPGEAIDINGAGVVLFESDRRDASSIRRDGGIFLGDGFEIVQVALAGEDIGGGVTVGRITGTDHGVKTGSLNKHGQVAFRGSESVFLFTPDLYWRGGPDGRWDEEVMILDESNPATRRNFTLSLVPDHVHHVIIDPARGGATGIAVPSVLVSGPASDTTIDRLTLRDNSVLELTGSHLTTLDTLNIESGAVLRGPGVLSGNITIETGGRLRPDRTFSFDAQSYNFPGDIHLEHRDLTINGAIENHGTIDIGRISGPNFVTTFNGDVMNHGDTVVGEVFPGQTSDNDELNFNGDFYNYGSLIISEFRNTDFYGDYYGPGNIINDGNLNFHGGFFPGASPVSAEIGGIGTLTLDSSARTIIELGGVHRGEFHNDPTAEYDSLDFVDGGTLALGGTLQIELIALDESGPVFAPEEGDFFLLFVAGAITGAFDQPYVLPELAEGLRWLVSNDGESFSLRVSAVPLPASVWMLLLALGTMTRLARRTNSCSTPGT